MNTQSLRYISDTGKFSQKFLYTHRNGSAPTYRKTVKDSVVWYQFHPNCGKWEWIVGKHEFADDLEKLYKKLDF